MLNKPIATGLACLLTLSATAFVQRSTDDLANVTHSASFTFAKRDGTCIKGTIQNVSGRTVTVQPFQHAPVIIQRDDLLRVGHGDALLYSARSSWDDVMGVLPYPREELAIVLKDGRRTKGKSLKIATDSITLRHAFSTTTYLKKNISSVDYLRLKPETDNFDFLSEEAPFLLLFNAETYYRAAGLEGRIPVRLYDASKPEDNSHLCTQITATGH